MRKHLVVLLILAACGGDDGEDPQKAIVARGEYLVEHVAACGNCHTPYANGAPDLTRRFAGVEDRHTVAMVGTINSANLTNHETGLKSWTDEEIKRALTQGIRKDGTVMWYQMPYYELANMSADDLTAMVAYLRTIPPVDHAMTRRPYELRTTPYASMTGDMVPQTTLAATDAKYASAQRGRYLASFGCLHCHTRVATSGDYYKDATRIFAGNNRFAPSNWVPKEVFSSNLTPHENGLMDKNVEQVKEAIKNSGTLLCAPMANVSKYFLSGMTDADATDIATYLTTLPPADTGAITACMP